jgi:hypothetical protein
MTLIVGAVATDGIVLAADQRAVQDTQQPNEMDNTMTIQKIVVLEHHGVAYACAGDESSIEVGREFSSRLNKPLAFDFGNIGQSLEGLANDRLEGEVFKQRWNQHVYRALLAVFYRKHELQLWHLAIQRRESIAKREREISIAGAPGNPARSFRRHFKSTTADRLAMLAAHIVLEGSRIDCLMINGLDVAIFENSGHRLLVEEEKDKLRKRSLVLDDLIRDHLLG